MKEVVEVGLCIHTRGILSLAFQEYLYNMICIVDIVT